MVGDLTSKERGVYHKFIVERTDGKSAPGQKHHGCFHFVLDCDHDPHARAALLAYAASCEADYPALASDVRSIVEGGAAFGSGEDKHVSDVLDIRAAHEPPAARKPDKFDLAFEIMRQLEAEDMETMQSCQFGYVMRVTRERAPSSPPGEPVAWCTASEWWGAYQSETVRKLTRHAQPEYGFTVPLYTRPSEPPAASQDAVRLRQFVESAGEQCNCADVIVDLRAALAGEWLYQQLPGWDPNNPTARPAETKSETVMSKVREHFDAQRDRDGYHSELERLEFAPPADPGPRCTCSDFHGAHEYCRAHETGDGR